MRKTNYTRQIVDDYCVLDTETTGFMTYDEVIEIGALRVRNNEVVAQYSQLVKPEYEIGSSITGLTGITNEMLADMPSILDVKEDVLSFLGNDVIVGHNIGNFDMRFLKKGFETEIDNQYVDTLQFAKKLYRNLPSHSLADIAKVLNLTQNKHRALADCFTTKELYDSIKGTMTERGLKIENLWSPHNHGRRRDVSLITPTTEDIDPDGFFFERHVIFTGSFERMTQEEAEQKVVDLGGRLDKSVKKTTNYLIVGSTESNSILRGNKSAKQKKAEELKSKGQDIEIIDQWTFYDIIDEELE